MGRVKLKVKNYKNIMLILSIFALIVATLCICGLQGQSFKGEKINAGEVYTEGGDAKSVVTEEEIGQALLELNEYIKNIDVDNFNLLDLKAVEAVEPVANKKWIIEVVLINANDAITFDDKLANDFCNRFNENIDNDFLSVHEFYSEMSKGKLDVWANVYLCNLDKPLSYFEDEVGKNLIEETLLWESARWKGNATLISGDYGVVNAKCNLLPCRRGTSGQVSWPHAYAVGPLMTLPYNKADVPTLCHESLHMLGLSDLYSNDGKNVVQTYDVMSETYNGNVSLSAYSRQSLGWIGSSKSNDSVVSEVESIVADGTYTLNVNTASKGIIAYSFGNRNSDVFYIEYRKSSKTFERRVNGSGLLVYRINKQMKGNLDYKKSGLYEMFVFSSGGYDLTDYNGYIKAGKSLGTATESGRLKLTYSDGFSSNFVITDIVENGNDTITFKISSNGDKYLKNGGIITCSELKQLAINSFLSVVAGISNFIYNPVGSINSLAQEVLISIDVKIDEIKNNLNSANLLANEILLKLQSSYEESVKGGGVSGALGGGIDFIKDGVQSAYSKITNNSSSLVSQLESLKDRISNYFKK